MTARVFPFEEFDALYCVLTGHSGACRWQYRLFSDLEAGRFPDMKTTTTAPCGSGVSISICPSRTRPRREFMGQQGMPWVGGGPRRRALLIVMQS
jgi:hypothetical protein